MRTLTTEKQVDLQDLIHELRTQFEGNMDHELLGRVRFWELELKPKRTRKKSTEDSNILVDNQPEV